MQNQYFLNHSPIDVYFRQSKEDFVVTEIPLYEWSNEGEHLILKVRKKDLTTWDMVTIFSNVIGVKSRDIGYAGLKDKNAMTIQYISIPREYETQLMNFEHPQIKILEKMYHNNKIRVGHLKGNKFFIRLKRVQSLDKQKLDLALLEIEKFGIPNYFGYQRFGIDGDNYLQGEKLLQGKIKVRDRKLRQMYINAYQSYLFNSWLDSRIILSKMVESFEASEIVSRLPFDQGTVKDLQKQPHPFKTLKGDVFSHYPYGKIFYVDNTQEEAEKFFVRDRVPTGLLCGKKTKYAIEDAMLYEKDFIHQTQEQGSRRFAWIFPSMIESHYNEEKNWYELSFELPKGSYATTLIEQLLKKQIND